MKAVISKFTYTTAGPAPKNAERCFQYIIIRMLIGALKIESNSKEINQTIDYSKITPQVQDQRNSTKVKEFIASETGHKSIKSFIRCALASNRSLYEDILLEFSNYFYQTNKGAHTAAFIFLYRALERLSFSIPLLYASQSKDYYATFNDLKSILEEGGQGELGLLKKFLNQGQFIDRTTLHVEYDISFSTPLTRENHLYKTATKIYKNFTDQDETRLTAKIKFINIHDFFICTRNRFFHSRTGDGQNNIRSSEIIDADEFFSIVNNTFCSYISVITLQTIAKMHAA